MRSRAVRLTLMLLAVSALATAAYLGWTIEQRNATIAADTNEVAWRLSAAARQTLEVRAAQQAYVAVGQSDQFWISKVTDGLAALQESLTSLRATSSSTTAKGALDRASQAIEEFARLDRRVRAYVSDDQRLLASDLVFSDGLETAQQVLTALDDARNAQVSEASSALTTSRRELAAVAGGGVAIAVFVLLLLTSPGHPREPEKVFVTAPPKVTAPRLETDTAKRAVVQPPPAEKPKPAPQIEDVADVCAQLARVNDTSALPALLQRTALALDANGVVLWIMDPDGTELLPVATHGYTTAMLSQMGPIPRQAENVTAAAFRTGLLQTIKGSADANGAIAAPLVNTSGCVGVLSAEVRNNGEKESGRLALATIVAAQLATLTAPATRSENRAAL